MSRKNKTRSEARANRTFRLSEYESQKLKAEANAAGMNESKYIRELILRGGVDTAYTSDRQNLIRQISGIATNVNQIAKHANECNWIGNTEILKIIMNLEEIKKLVKELILKWR